MSSDKLHDEQIQLTQSAAAIEATFDRLRARVEASGASEVEMLLIELHEEMLELINGTATNLTRMAEVVTLQSQTIQNMARVQTRMCTMLVEITGVDLQQENPDVA